MNRISAPVSLLCSVKANTVGRQGTSCCSSWLQTSTAAPSQNKVTAKARNVLAPSPLLQKLFKQATQFFCERSHLHRSLCENCWYMKAAVCTWSFNHSNYTSRGGMRMMEIKHLSSSLAFEAKNAKNCLAKETLSDMSCGNLKNVSFSGNVGMFPQEASWLEKVVQPDYVCRKWTETPFFLFGILFPVLAAYFLLVLL